LQLYVKSENVFVNEEFAIDGSQVDSVAVSE